MKRNIVIIDEELCDGCGLCATACAEGAIEIIDGKARLVSDIYCDGLGACLGECPRNAIRIEEVEARPFDEEAVKERLRRLNLKNRSRNQICQNEPDKGTITTKNTAQQGNALPTFKGCPGSMSRQFGKKTTPVPEAKDQTLPVSQLGHWPVQLKLVSPMAPFLRQADLLLVADCVPFAFAGFHQKFLPDKAVVVGCPKLDDAGYYAEKLADIFQQADIRSLTVIHMEVPCCSGLLKLTEVALQASGRDIPIRDVMIGIQGDILQDNIINTEMDSV